MGALRLASPSREPRRTFGALEKPSLNIKAGVTNSPGRQGDARRPLSCGVQLLQPRNAEARHKGDGHTVKAIRV